MEKLKGGQVLSNSLMLSEHVWFWIQVSGNVTTADGQELEL